MSKSLAIEFFAGASHEFSFTVAEATPMDSHQASIEVSRGPGKPVVFSFSTEDGTITRAGQKLTVKLLPEASLGKAGKYEYQLQITQGSTIVKFTDIFPWTIKATL